MPPPDWPPPADAGILSTAEIAGGFEPLTVQHLMALWWLLRSRRLALFDLRIYLAGVEQHHRLTQGTAARERPYFYLMDLGELAGLGWQLDHRQERRLEASLAHLRAVGLLSWTEEDIDVAEASGALPQADRTPFAEWLHTSDIRNGRRPVPVPRRMLRHIAAGNVRRTTFATLLGVMVRCLHFDKREELPCRSGGRCSVAWIAATFAVDAASVKRALDGLTRLGWLARLSQSSRKQQRDGAVTVINPWWKPNNLVDQEAEAIDVDKIDIDGSVAVTDDQDVDLVHPQTRATPGAAGPTCASPDHSGCSNGQRDEQEAGGFSEAAGGTQVGQGRGFAASDGQSGEGAVAACGTDACGAYGRDTKLRPQAAKNDTKLRPRPTPNCAPGRHQTAPPS